ncbi:MAG: sigma-54-dependent Fis family transcriptional regulator [Deltaproteobacteria bacterium]|nr:sigma-54-dependent Fis family transcriptional regulator [Deltaproteobacteria bacterium]
MATVLIIDDEQNILVTLARALQLENYQTEVAGSGKLGLEKLGQGPDLVLLDVMLPDLDGLDVLAQIHNLQPELPVIMMSGHATVEIAVKAVQLGAKDFLEKPLSSEKVLVTVANALALRRLADENKTLRTLAGMHSRMLGRSRAMQTIAEQIQLVAPSQGRVLITGENGTGKELVARAVHEQSDRRDGPFVKLNCAAVPKELIESELFGHEKGAFTGAHQSRKGKFELADTGSLFLDEVGDMPMAMQAKLLRVLQEGEFERVGSGETREVDVRVIAATNQDLAAAIDAERFRRDLFYRLNVVPISLPPLRQRREDIPELAAHFLIAACQHNNKHTKILTSEALKALAEHDYPGNVRELKNGIERLVIMVPAEEISAADVRRWLLPGGAGPAIAGGGPSIYSPDKQLRDMVAEAERGFIEKALKDCEGHVTNAARQLNLERSHLYKKMKALGIK